jgi:Tol biopolymer transport system component
MITISTRPAMAATNGGVVRANRSRYRTAAGPAVIVAALVALMTACGGPPRLDERRPRLSAAQLQAHPRRPLAAVILAVGMSVLSVSACSEGADTRPDSPSTAAPQPSAVSFSSAPSVSSSPSEEERAQGLRGRIIFTRAGGTYGDETVFTAVADGSQEQQLTESGVNCCPRVSADGRHVLLAAPAKDGDGISIGIVGYNGRGFRTLPRTRELNMGPGAWSRDGELIAVQGWDDQRPQRNGAYLVRASDGAMVRRLTAASARGNHVPLDFSPDGKQIVFFHEPPNSQSIGSLWVVNVDGGKAHQITPPSVKASISARWSPDGRQILFATARNQETGALWTVRPDGSRLTKLFEDDQGRFAITPTWSPDGEHVMFALNPTSDEFSHPPNGLYVVDSDGRNLALVLAGDDFKRLPDWVE